MARPSIVSACAVVALAAATPSLANSPADASRCGAKLVAGWARCIDWVMKISEHRSLEAKALKGDNDAAWKLAGFHLMANEEAIAALVRSFLQQDAFEGGSVCRRGEPVGEGAAKGAIG